MEIGVPTFERVKITKRREGSAWRVYVDGIATALFIVKGPPPRYREPQTYDVFRGDADDWIFEAKSVSAAETAIAMIMGERPFEAAPTAVVVGG